MALSFLQTAATGVAKGAWLYGPLSRSANSGSQLPN